MGNNVLSYRCTVFSIKMLKSQASKKTESQRKWRARNPDAEKKYNPQVARRYLERYHTDLKFQADELDRQREYYDRNREKVLARIKARKAREKRVKKI
ncbi:MAG: hypothetical protein HUU50_02735 [Candidatus Brocadiae bacterium]|nr:hypothetical protein [Candidatus Brocadiia bacterium]